MSPHEKKDQWCDEHGYFVYTCYHTSGEADVWGWRWSPRPFWGYIMSHCYNEKENKRCGCHYRQRAACLFGSS